MLSNKSIATASTVVLLVLAGAGVSPPARAGSISYDVSVDTTGLAGQAGFFEAQLSAAGPPSTPTVTATILHVSSDATPGAIAFTAGDYSGSFAGALLVLANDNLNSAVPGLSDVQQSETYGTYLSFTLTLSGAEVNGSEASSTGTVFSFLLEDSSGTGLNAGPLAGEAFDVDVDSNGTVTVSPNDPYMAGGPVAGYAPAVGAHPTVSIAPASVPEPSGIVLLGLGLGILVAVARRPRRRPAA